MNRTGSSVVFSQCRCKSPFPLLWLEVSVVLVWRATMGPRRLDFPSGWPLVCLQRNVCFFPWGSPKLFRELLCPRPSIYSESLCQNSRIEEQRPDQYLTRAWTQSFRSFRISDCTFHRFLPFSLLPLVLGCLRALSWRASRLSLWGCRFFRFSKFWYVSVNSLVFSAFVKFILGGTFPLSFQWNLENVTR